MFEEFDYNHTTLAPLGTRLAIHNRPNYRASRAQHGEAGWYIRLDMEYYVYHKAYIAQNKSVTNLRHIGVSPPRNQHAKNVFHICKNSCRTVFNSCTTKSSTCQTSTITRKLSKSTFEIFSRYIWRSYLTNSTSEGANQGVIPRDTPTG